jgi:hypothetical protein
MSHITRRVCTIAAGLPLLAASALGQDRAGGRPASPAGSEQPRAAKAAVDGGAAAPEFKVVFWYDHGNWRTRAYDVRKGQFTKAVADWVRWRDSDPHGEMGYVLAPQLAYVLDVHLGQEPGRDEREKLAAAVARELARIDEFASAVLGAAIRHGRLGALATPPPPLRRAETPARVRLPLTLGPAPGADRPPVAPVPAFMPPNLFRHP